MNRHLSWLLTVLTLVMLLLFALAVPSPRVTDEADERYRESLMENTDDNWLLQYTD